MPFEHRHLGRERVFRPRRAVVRADGVLELPLQLDWPDEDDPGWGEWKPICRRLVEVVRQLEARQPFASRPASTGRRPDPMKALKKRR